MRRDDEADFIAYATTAGPALRRTAYLMCGDWQHAEDAAQEALIRMYLAWPRLIRRDGVRTYGHRALVSVVIDQSRRPWRRERPGLETEPSRDERYEPAVAVDNRMLIVAALAQLPPKQRVCVVLRYYDDLSVCEVAAVLDISEGTVKSRTARGLAALERTLTDAGHAVATRGEGS